MAELSSITDTTFTTEVAEADQTVVVDFWAEWCGPCKALSPLLAQAASEVPGIKVVKMNIDENLETPVKFGIRGIPTLMAFRNGEPVGSLVGLRDKGELVNWLTEQSA